jgi:hypothetical protein
MVRKLEKDKNNKIKIIRKRIKFLGLGKFILFG